MVLATNRHTVNMHSLSHPRGSDLEPLADLLIPKGEKQPRATYLGLPQSIPPSSIYFPVTCPDGCPPSMESMAAAGISSAGRGVRGLAWVPSTGLDQGTGPGWGLGPEALRVFFSQSAWEMCLGPASMPTRLLLTPEANTQMKPGGDRQETPRGQNSQETPTVQSLPTSLRDGAELRRERVGPS